MLKGGNGATVFRRCRRLTYFRATFGILFFGVPNQGMDISSLLAMVRGQPNLHFLSTLSKDGGFLQGLIKKFRATFDS